MTTGEEQRRDPAAGAAPAWRWVAGGLAGVAGYPPLAAAAGGLAAAALAAVLAVLTASLLARLPGRPPRERDASLVTGLPEVVDLLSACFVAGLSLPVALSVVSEAVGGAWARELDRAAAGMRLGATARQACGRLLASDEPVRALARALTVGAETGAPLAELLDQISDDVRRAASAAGLAVVRRAAVSIVLPLGLCFLPAFVVVGVVPLVVGVLGQLR